MGNHQLKNRTISMKMHNAIVFVVSNIVSENNLDAEFLHIYKNEKSSYSEKAERMMALNNTGKTLVVKLNMRTCFVKARNINKRVVDVDMAYQKMNGCDGGFAVLVECDGKRYLGAYKPNSTKTYNKSLATGKHAAHRRVPNGAATERRYYTTPDGVTKVVRLASPAQQQYLAKRYGQMDAKQIVEAARGGDKDAGTYLVFVYGADYIIRPALCRYNGKIPSVAILGPEGFAQTVATNVWDACNKTGWEKVANITYDIRRYLGGIARTQATKLFNELNPEDTYTMGTLEDVCSRIKEVKDKELWNAAEEATKQREMLEWLDAAREQLNDAERYVLEAWVERGLTIAEIAKELPVAYWPEQLRGFDKELSGYHVRKIVDDAVEKLKKMAGAA